MCQLVVVGLKYLDTLLLIELTRAHVPIPCFDRLHRFLYPPQFSTRFLQAQPLLLDLLDQPHSVPLLFSRLSLTLYYHLFVLLDLTLQLHRLLPLVLHLPLHLCTCIVYFITFIGQALVTLLQPLYLTLHLLVCSHLFSSLSSQLSKFCVPLSCNVVQPHVSVLQLPVVFLGVRYLRAQPCQLLSERVYLHALFNE